MPQPFPHLRPAEGLIWAQFLREHGAEWDGYDYDVRVGQGHPIDPAWPDYIKVMVGKLSPKRIDAVGYKGDVPTIFEVSPSGDRHVVGALLMYRYLYQQQYPMSVRPDLVAVLGRVDPDLSRFMPIERIRIELVTPVTA